MNARDRDTRRTYTQFPGRRDSDYPVQAVAPGTIPRLNGMPGLKLYTYRGSGQDTITTKVCGETVTVTVRGRHEIARMCPPCWDENCDMYAACLGEPCACPCRDGDAP